MGGCFGGGGGWIRVFWSHNGPVLIWQCIRFIPACPVSIPTLFIAAQSGGQKKPPQDEGAVLAPGRPTVTLTHSNSPTPSKSILLASAVGETCSSCQFYNAAFVSMLILCLQRILPRIVRVDPRGSFCGDYFGSNGLSRQCPMPTSTKYKVPATWYKNAEKRQSYIFYSIWDFFCFFEKIMKAVFFFCLHQLGKVLERHFNLMPFLDHVWFLNYQWFWCLTSQSTPLLNGPFITIIFQTV